MPTLGRQRFVTAAIVVFGGVAIEATPCFAQGYTVGGSRPSQDIKLKVHGELAIISDQRSATLPKIGLAWPANDTLELGIDVHARHLERADGRRESGFGDVDLKGKQLLLDARRNALGVDVSAELKIVLPLGDAKRGLGAGQPAVKLPVTFSRKSGPWEFGGLIGAQTVWRRDKAMILGGALVTRELGGGFKVGGEIATEMRLRAPHRQELMVNLGLRHLTRRSVEIFMIAGHSIVTRDERAVAKFKLGLEFKISRKKTNND